MGTYVLEKDRQGKTIGHFTFWRKTDWENKCTGEREDLENKWALYVLQKDRLRKQMGILCFWRKTNWENNLARLQKNKTNGHFIFCRKTDWENKWALYVLEKDRLGKET